MIVQHFCDGFVTSRFSRLYDGATDETPKRLSFKEEFRILRALYRAELYWKTMGGYVLKWGRREQNNMFFDYYPPWVNEQLGCVNHFLEEELGKCTYRTIHSQRSRMGAKFLKGLMKLRLMMWNGVRCRSIG